MFVSTRIAANAVMLAASVGAGAAMAQQPAPQSANAPEPAASGATQMSTGAMTDGEVRKVDKENSNITLRHGEIKNLEMPGMTMVFQVKDPAMLDLVKQGDKVLFKAEKANGALVVTEIQPVK